MFEKNNSGRDTIDIGGEKIVLGTLGEEDLQVDEELRSQDLVNFMQTEDMLFVQQESTLSRWFTNICVNLRSPGVVSL